MEDLRGLYSHIAGTVHRMAPFFICLTQGINHRNNRDNGSRDSRFIKAGLNNLRRDERTNAIVHSDQTQTAILLPLPTPLRQKPIQPILNREEASISPLSRSHAGPCSRFPCKAYSNTADDPPEAQGLYVRKHPNDEKPLTYASKRFPPHRNKLLRQISTHTKPFPPATIKTYLSINPIPPKLF